MELKQPKMISKKAFQAMFAPDVGIKAIDDLFHVEGFPAAQLGRFLYTTDEAAARWLSCMGRDELMRESGNVGSEEQAI
jgi:hypothetical protein